MIEVSVSCPLLGDVCEQFWFTLFLDLGFCAVAGPVLDCGRYSKSGCTRPGLACPSLALGFKTFGSSDRATPDEPRRQVRVIFRVTMSVSTVLTLKGGGLGIEMCFFLALLWFVPLACW